MKYFILFSLLISANVFAIDFQKVTGTFDVKDSKAPAVLGQDTVAQAAFGTFELTQEGRVPASVTSEDKKSDSSVTEITGTFE